MPNFIEFSVKKGKRKFIVEVNSITSVSMDEAGFTMINGEEVDQSYEEVLNLLSDYANVGIDRDLTKKGEIKETVK